MAPNYLALPFHAIHPQRFLDGQRAAFEVFQYAPLLFFYARVAFFERHVCQREAMYAGEFGRRVQVVFLQDLGVRAQCPHDFTLLFWVTPRAIAADAKIQPQTRISEIDHGIEQFKKRMP